MLTESLFVHPFSSSTTTYVVETEGVAIGVAVLLLTILIAGVQLNTPLPDANNCKASCRQITVSLKPSVIGGLSRILIVLTMVSLHPFEFETNNCTFLFP